MRFVDATIFVKWMAAIKKRLSLESAIAGYVLKRIQDGEVAITSSIVKDEVLIWLSRYRASRLRNFLRALRIMPTLRIINPTLNDEEFAAANYGKFELGISDLINVSIMRRMNIDEIYTTDIGYGTAGVRVVLYELQKEPEFGIFIDYLKKKGFRPIFK